MTDAYYLKAIEDAYLDFSRGGDYGRFVRAVEAALRAWRGQ